jgi:predicted transcriptional regulator
VWYNNNVIKGRKTLNKPKRRKENIMTNREFYTAIINNANVAQDIKDFAQGEIAKLDARNDKRKNTQTKAQKENEGIMTSILDHLANGSAVASDIATAVGISTQKASALCKLLVDGGKVTVADIKVKNKGTVKQYTLVTSDTEAEEVEEE